MRAAEDCAETMANSISPEQCVRVLNPIVQTAEYPVNLAAIKMQTKVSPSLVSPFVQEAQRVSFWMVIFSGVFVANFLGISFVYMIAFPDAYQYYVDRLRVLIHSQRNNENALCCASADLAKESKKEKQFVHSPVSFLQVIEIMDAEALRRVLPDVIPGLLNVSFG